MKEVRLLFWLFCAVAGSAAAISVEGVREAAFAGNLIGLIAAIWFAIGTAASAWWARLAWRLVTE